MDSGERLRLLVVLSGRQQGELARAAGVSEALVSRVLSGDRALTRRTRERLARALVDAIIEARSRP